jgi:hypothetical protein
MKEFKMLQKNFDLFFNQNQSRQNKEATREITLFQDDLEQNLVKLREMNKILVDKTGKLH